jgi:uncharacterized protein DUF2442/SMI1/KNR4 family protein SUKH-1
MTTSSLATETAAAKHVRVTEHALVVELRDGRSVSVPIEWYPRLAEGRPSERRHWELIGRASAFTGPTSTRTFRLRGCYEVCHPARALHHCSGGGQIAGARPTNEWSRRAQDRESARLIRSADMTLFDSLRKEWETQGIANPQLPTSLDLAAFEARHGIRLPTAVAEYFLRVNGTKEGRFGMEDTDLVSFWHLEQIETLAVVSPGDPTPAASSLFVFADWSIEAHAWAVRLSADVTDATPVMITYGPAQEVASSFEEFLQGYLRREKRVLFPEPRRTGPVDWLRHKLS